MTPLPLPLPPETFTQAGVALRVTRAWPLPEESALILECADGEQRRAALWDQSGLRLQPTDTKLSALAEAAPGGVVVSHRWGRRAVVHQGERYIKVVRRGRSSAIMRGIARAGVFAETFRTPEVLELDDSTVTFSALEGLTLHDPALFSAVEWGHAWHQVMGAWTRAVRDGASSLEVPGLSGLTDGGETVTHGPAQEVQVLQRWAGLVQPFIENPDLLWRNVETVSARLRGLPDVPLRPAHRDLHDKQLLWSPSAGPGLLDVDTACLADPALDLGNLRAHARLRVLQQLWAPHEARTVVAAVEAAAAQIGVSSSALRVYEQAAALRLGCVYAVRPAYSAVAAGLRLLDAPEREDENFLIPTSRSAHSRGTG